MKLHGAVSVSNSVPYCPHCKTAEVEWRSWENGGEAAMARVGLAGPSSNSLSTNKSPFQFVLYYWISQNVKMNLFTKSLLKTLGPLIHRWLCCGNVWLGPRIAVTITAISRQELHHCRRGRLGLLLVSLTSPAWEYLHHWPHSSSSLYYYY